MAVERVSDMTVDELKAMIAQIVDERIAPENPVLPKRLLEYDEANDPIIQGLFAGPPDLASRAREILEAEFGLRKEDKDA